VAGRFRPIPLRGAPVVGVGSGPSVRAAPAAGVRDTGRTAARLRLGGLKGLGRLGPRVAGTLPPFRPVEVLIGP